MRWLLGYVGISLIVGSLITWGVWKVLHWFYKRTEENENWKIPESQSKKIPVLPFLVGILERTIFTILIAFEVPGVAGGMFAWVGIKMIVGWNRVTGKEMQHRMLGFTGLIPSVTSMLFAVLGGLVSNGYIPIPGIPKAIQ